jgi:hypothetical protein
MQQLQGLLPQQHSGVQFAPHPQLPMAILMQGSGPNRIDAAAAGGEAWGSTHYRSVTDKIGACTVPAEAVCVHWSMSGASASSC